MWGFLLLRLKRLVWLLAVVKLARWAALTLAERLEKRNHGATTASRTLVWISDVLPKSRRERAARA